MIRLPRRMRREYRMDRNQILRTIPRVDDLMKEPAVLTLSGIYGKKETLRAVREELDCLREQIIKASENGPFPAVSAAAVTEGAALRLEERWELSLRKVFNATGIILHTNLGRAPLGERQMEAAFEAMSGYSNLEYNLLEGKRGKRWEHYTGLISRVTGSEGAIAVNNNAAAVTLILSTIARGKEVIVSRGELIEIGGRFRIPEVMEQSGAVLRETGCTNRTRISDYERAITENTGALLKVHTSNYRILGFTEEASIEELVRLGEKYQLPVIVDLGSGVLVDLEKFGLSHEPTVQEILKKGADLVCFSGDKLLGGPQAGVIVGKKKYIDQMKKNQLTRALRIDKFTAAALELVLKEYLSEETAIRNVPVLRMITKPLEEIEKEAKSLVRMLRRSGFSGHFQVVPCESQIGGGSLPLERIPSFAAAVRPEKISVPKLEEKMRHLEIPIIPRTANDMILLDVRTIDRQQFKVIADQFRSMEDEEYNHRNSGAY